MQNPRLAARYAKSLIDISVEQNQLEAVKKEVAFIAEIANSSSEFRLLFRSPIINGDKKLGVLKALSKDGFTPIMSGFLKLVARKGRENVLPEIMHAFIEQYEKLKGIHRVKVTLAQPISATLRENLLNKIKTDTGIEHIALTEVIDENIIGGFILEYDNKLVDASLQRDLRDIRRQFKSNDYLFNIR